MIQLNTACVSSVDEARGNSSNLLFSGQILPERNAGLNGAPSLRLEPGAACVAAVFDGAGSAGSKAAYIAASAFRSVGESLRSTEDLEEIYTKIHNDICAAAAVEGAQPMAAAAVAACVDGDRLSLASLGSCRAYLLRGEALYLLSRASADAAAQTAPPAPGEGPSLGLNAIPPFTVNGVLLPGDQLLLCTGWLCEAVTPRETLQTLLDAETPCDALQRLVRRSAGRRGDAAAVLLKADAASEAE